MAGTADMAGTAAKEQQTLAQALEAEHRTIDEGIAAFVAGERAGDASDDTIDAALECLRRHIFLEEEMLFPPLRSSGLMAPVLVMLREHGQLWQTMDALDTARRDGTAGEVRDRCTELAGLLDAHNSKEEPIIYPQADTVLDEGARNRLWSFLRSGEMPEGWTAQMAPA